MGRYSDLENPETKLKWIFQFEVDISKSAGISPSSVIVRNLSEGSINVEWIMTFDPVTGQPAMESAKKIAAQLATKNSPIYSWDYHMYRSTRII